MQIFHLYLILISLVFFTDKLKQTGLLEDVSCVGLTYIKPNSDIFK